MRDSTAPIVRQIIVIKIIIVKRGMKWDVACTILLKVAGGGRYIRTYNYNVHSRQNL